MSNIQDIIKLAKIDGGKFFVMDEAGNASLVIMSVEEYQKMLLGKLQSQTKQQSEDVEKINKIITQVQFQNAHHPKNFKGLPRTDQSDWSGTGAQIFEEENSVVETVPVKRQSQFMQPDMRSEVIDPSFDFEAPSFGMDDF